MSDSTKLAGTGVGLDELGQHRQQQQLRCDHHGHRHPARDARERGDVTRPARAARRLNLDGSNDYVSLPEGSVAGLTDFSISTWVRLDTTAASRRVFDFGTGTSDYMYLTPTNGSTVRFGITTNGSGSEQVINGSTGLATGTWVHVTVTRIGTTGRMYVNGTQVGSNASMTLSPSSLGTTTQNWIGRSQFRRPLPRRAGRRLPDLQPRALRCRGHDDLRAGSTTPTGMLARYAFENNANDSVGAGGPSAVLLATGFGFAIPTGSVIHGVEAWVERSASASSALSDNEVHLLKAGAQVGSNYASATTYTTTDETEDYGARHDLWGTTWTAERDQRLQLRAPASGSTATRRSRLTAYVDHITITRLLPAAADDEHRRLRHERPPGPRRRRLHLRHAGGAHAVHRRRQGLRDTITTSPSGLEQAADRHGLLVHERQAGAEAACTTIVGTPPVWDNDSTLQPEPPGHDAWSEVTPTNRSYTCQVHDCQNNLLGELSWNHTTHVLKIFGTIFLDGDFRFDDNGQIVHYQGRGIIYAARDIEFDELVCAGGTGTAELRHATRHGELGPLRQHDDRPGRRRLRVRPGAHRPAPVDAVGSPGDHLRPATTARCTRTSTSAGRSSATRSRCRTCANGWPTYYTWPPLGSLVEGQAYGSPNNAADYVVTAGDQFG